MAIKWVLDAIVSFLSWVINGLPAPSVPAWLTGLDSGISAISTVVGQLQNWIPGTLAVTILASVLLAYGIAMTIRVVRMVASFLTGGGGSAA